MIRNLYYYWYIANTMIVCIANTMESPFFNAPRYSFKERGPNVPNAQLLD